LGIYFKGRIGCIILLSIDECETVLSSRVDELVLEYRLRWGDHKYYKKNASVYEHPFNEREDCILYGGYNL
jgi:hypothetical protein